MNAILYSLFFLHIATHNKILIAESFVGAQHKMKVRVKVKAVCE